MSHEPSEGANSTKEVAGHQGIEVAQPGLIPLYHQSQFESNNAAEISQQYAPQEPKPRICGLRKVTFWLVLGLAILAVVVIGVAAGLGAGLSKARSEGDSGTSSDGAILTSTLSATSSTSTSTGTSATSSTGTSAPTSTATSAPSTICPEANNTVITQGIGPIRYRILCDSDFGGSGKKNLASLVLPSFDKCLNLCNTMNYFQDRSDVGCTYNVAGSGSQSPGTCWCLGGDDKQVVASEGNDVAQPI